MAQTVQNVSTPSSGDLLTGRQPLRLALGPLASPSVTRPTWVGSGLSKGPGDGWDSLTGTTAPPNCLRRKGLPWRSSALPVLWHRFNRHQGAKTPCATWHRRDRTETFFTSKVLTNYPSRDGKPNTLFGSTSLSPSGCPAQGCQDAALRVDSFQACPQGSDREDTMQRATGLSPVSGPRHRLGKGFLEEVASTLPSEVSQEEPESGQEVGRRSGPPWREWQGGHTQQRPGRRRPEPRSSQ